MFYGHSNYSFAVNLLCYIVTTIDLRFDNLKVLIRLTKFTTHFLCSIVLTKKQKNN